MRNYSLMWLISVLSMFMYSFGNFKPGKSLFTTIRELVENSLDAAEAIHVLPVVKVKVKEYSEEDHNTRHGIKKNISIGNDEGDGGISRSQSLTQEQVIVDLDTMSQSATTAKKHRKSVGGETKELMYYEISVEDNGEVTQCTCIFLYQ